MARLPAASDDSCSVGGECHARERRNNPSQLADDLSENEKQHSWREDFSTPPDESTLDSTTARAKRESSLRARFNAAEWAAFAGIVAKCRESSGTEDKKARLAELKALIAAAGEPKQPALATSISFAADYGGNDELNLLSCLDRCDARTLRELKAVSLGWRKRARAVLSNASGTHTEWRQHPVWGACRHAESPEGMIIVARLRGDVVDEDEDEDEEGDAYGNDIRSGGPRAKAKLDALNILGAEPCFELDALGNLSTLAPSVVKAKLDIHFELPSYDAVVAELLADESIYNDVDDDVVNYDDIVRIRALE
eukprot:1673667-Prymnesium_polylepis.2